MRHKSLVIAFLVTGCGFKTEATDRLDAADGSISDLNDSVSALQGSVETLTTGLATTNSDATTLGNRVGALEETANTSTDRLDALESDVMGAQSDISTLQTDVEGAASDISDLDGRVTELEAVHRASFSVLANALAHNDTLTSRSVGLDWPSGAAGYAEYFAPGPVDYAGGDVTATLTFELPSDVQGSVSFDAYPNSYSPGDRDLGVGTTAWGPNAMVTGDGYYQQKIEIAGYDLEKPIWRVGFRRTTAANPVRDPVVLASVTFEYDAKR